MNTIANGKITLPAIIWKVIEVHPVGDDDAAIITNTTRVITLETLNTNKVSSTWGAYMTSVDAIESVTSYNLLSRYQKAYKVL